MIKGMFVVGTGTDIGKTYVTGLIVKALIQSGKKAAYYKAAMSGNERDEKGELIPGDALAVKKLSGTAQELSEMCPYIYEAAVSPHLAAKIEGKPIELSIVKDGFAKLSQSYEWIVAEGSGGIICPIRHDEQKIMLPDVIKSFDLPCVLIADAGLGTINSVVLTCEYMKNHNIPLKGIIFNRYDESSLMVRDNLAMCEELTGLKVLAVVKEKSDRLEYRGAGEEEFFSLFAEK